MKSCSDTATIAQNEPKVVGIPQSLTLFDGPSRRSGGGIEEHEIGLQEARRAGIAGHRSVGGNGVAALACGVAQDEPSMDELPLEQEPSG